MEDVMAETFKVGVIGVGGINRTHMPGWAASPYAEVVAGADVSEQNLRLWGEKHGVARLTTRLEDLFESKDIDIIDICTPNMYHTPLVIAALEAGKHVICEKPLAPTTADIRKMIEARDRSGKELMTAQHFRFSGVARACKAEIDTGALGDIYHARSWMLRRNAFIPTPTFVYKKHAGGGACIDIGVHILDLTLWMMGSPKPVAVSGVARTELSRIPGAFSVWHPGSMPEDMDVEEMALAFVRFEGGATMILEVAWILHHDTEVEDMQMWLYGTRGGCHWPSNQFLSSNYETKQHYNRQLKLSKDIMEPHAFECYEFARALAHGEPSPVPPEQSLHVLSILEGIYQSQKEGREIRLQEV
jgi:predicted dehydrogenase